MPVTWLGKTYVIQQTNGQCIIVLSTKMNERLPPNELYVKGIPRQYGPQELVPIFSSAGVVHTIRLLMDFDQNNRGFAYVSYVYSGNIHRALCTLNGLRISVKQRMTLTRSRNARSFQLCNIFHRPISLVAQMIAQITRIEDFQCTLSRQGETNGVTITFKTHNDYIHAFAKINRVRHTFGPTCSIRTVL